jgi:hypothetical protein
MENDKSVIGAYRFTVGPSSDPSKAGQYDLKWKFRYSQQPTNYIETPFIVQVIDRCDPHIPNFSPQPLVLPSSIANQEYTITDYKEYIIPEFTTSPLYCQSRLTYRWNNPADSSPTITGSQGDAVTFDAPNRKKIYDYSGDTDLAGLDEFGINYLLTVHADLPGGATNFA